MTTRPDQPPKQASYTQAANPITQTPQERQPNTRTRGDNVPAITRRTAGSNPSNPESITSAKHQREASQTRLQNAPEVDLEYGVELQPNEGEIADAVEKKSLRARAQAGAHAGPVGSAEGPGHPGFGEERDLAADLPKKRAEHDRVLGDRVGQSPAAPEGDEGRQLKLEQNREIDVKGAVEEGTGHPVVASGS